MTTPSFSPDFEQIDFFTSEAFGQDPHPYYEFVRSQGPIWREPHHGVFIVTSFEAATQVLRDTERFSSATSVTGPFPGIPIPAGCEDASEIIEQQRWDLPMSDQIITMDMPEHARHRALLMRLLTPNRLKENEDFMWRLADRQIDEFHASGKTEFIVDYSQPFAMLVIADLLGVPDEDRADFRAHLTQGGGLGSVDEEAMALNPLEYLYDRFSDYVADRRKSPREDVLTGMAQATFPDGALPEVIDVVRVAANLFAAGQETTVRLIAASLQMIADRPDLQAWLREDKSRIPNFVEEMLRCEGPVKGDFRMSRVPTTIEGVDVPAGATIMIMIGAINRDPTRFENPYDFDPERKNARLHMAFGLGIHSCPGGPLARTETRISLERILDRMDDIRLDESQHGPAGARRFEYAPTYILRGLQNLHLQFTPK